jgi:putative NIF3 family GTP cyclohydrolase 1 type 2
MEPIRSVRADDLTGRTLIEAARLGVAVLSMHTNLDAAPGGLNDELVSRLGLGDVVTPLPARCARLGHLEAPERVSVFAKKVARALRIDQLRIIADGDPEVQRIFCATGSGMGYLPDARTHRADLILTGDVRYHAAVEALEMGIPVIDAGHFGLERMAGELLMERFSKEFQRLGVEVGRILCDSEREPFETLS